MRAQDTSTDTDTTHDRSGSRRLPRATPVTGLLALQRAAGNMAVTRAIHAQRQGHDADSPGGRADSNPHEEDAEGIELHATRTAAHAADHTAAGDTALVARALAPQVGAGNAAVTRWVRERRATPAPPTAAVQRAPDWKNNPMKAALGAEKALAPNDPFVHTLHHIVPKSTLAAFAGLLTPAQRTLVVQKVGPHAQKAFTTTNDDLAAVSKALRNLPANVVLGPKPEARNDDPDSDPDYNYEDDGSITPRSEHLQKAYEFMNRKITGVTPVTITNAELTSEFIQPLIDASKEHNKFAAGGVGLDRSRAAWSGDPTQKQAHRRRLEPLL